MGPARCARGTPAEWDGGRCKGQRNPHWPAKDVAMTVYSAPLREMRFVLHDVFHAADQLTALPAFADATADVMDAVLDECAKLCEGVLFPINQSGDLEGCTFKDGKVTTPKGFK